MPKAFRIPLTAVLLAVFFGILIGKSSARFPPVYSDEVVFSVHGYNFLSGQGHRYSLYDDIFDRSVYPIRDALPDITRILYNTWDALWLKTFSRGYRQARWSSVAAAVMCLLVLYAIGRMLRSPKLGLLMVTLTALNPVFMFSASIVRPEILLLLGTSFVLWLLLRIPSTWAWKHFTVGLAIGLLSAVHWNVLALAAGFLVVYALREGPERRGIRLVWMMGGMIGGGLLAFRTVDPGKFLLSLRTVNYLVSTPPPLLADPWHPWRWVGQLASTFFLGQTSFINLNLVPGWAFAIGMSWIGLFVALAASFLKSKRRLEPRSWKRALAAGGFVTFAALTCLLKRQELTYAVILIPFLIPLAADAWMDGSVPMVVFRLRALAGIILLGSTLAYAYFVGQYIPLRPSYDQISQTLHEQVADPSLRLAGPAVLWFAWDAEKFRDIGAITTSGWYTGGRRDLAGCLSPWKPEVLVIDPTLRHILWRSRAALPELQKTFQARVLFLGVIPMSDKQEEDWEVYRLFWDLRPDPQR